MLPDVASGGRAESSPCPEFRSRRPYNQTLPDGSRRGPPVATARSEGCKEVEAVEGWLKDVEGRIKSPGAWRTPAARKAYQRRGYL